MLVPDAVAPTGERAKLLDFGLAKLAHDASRPATTTRSNHIMGTPLYMSPEQCRGAGVVDERTDVYSLGVMLYQLLAGRPPFVAEGVGELISQHLLAPPPLLIEQAPRVPAELAELVHRLLRKDKDERPSMAEVVSELERLEARQGSAGLRPIMAPQSEPEPGIAQGQLKELLAGVLEPETEEERSFDASLSVQSAMGIAPTMPSSDQSLPGTSVNETAPVLASAPTLVSQPSTMLVAGELPQSESSSRTRRGVVVAALFSGLLLAGGGWLLQPWLSPSHARMVAPKPTVKAQPIAKAEPPVKAEPAAPAAAPAPQSNGVSVPKAAVASAVNQPVQTASVAPVVKEKAALHSGSRLKPATRLRQPTPLESKPLDAPRKLEFKIID